MTYKLIIEKGTSELYWIAGDNGYTIANDSLEDTEEYIISFGDNYEIPHRR